MGSLTGWVLEESLEQCAKWRADGSQLAVSVNVSPSNLLEPGFIAMVSDQLARNSLPAEALVLEITETSIITDFERAKVVIDALSRVRRRGLGRRLRDGFHLAGIPEQPGGPRAEAGPDVHHARGGPRQAARALDDRAGPRARAEGGGGGRGGRGDARAARRSSAATSARASSSACPSRPRQHRR